MTGRIFTADHHVYDLPVLLEWTLVHTGSVPCDTFTVTFPYEKEMAEVLTMAAGFGAMEDGKFVLRGIVDEYTVDMDVGGLTATVSGRGYAARLLDNESRPVTYQNVTLEELIRCHAEPYGIQCAEAADLRVESGYSVAAGTSQWKVLQDFCRTYGGFEPRFAATGELLAVPEEAGETCLQLGEEDGILSCTLREDHYGVLTEVMVIDKKSGMSYTVRNEDMIRKGGQCRRVVYTPGVRTWAAMRYTGEYQIQQSKAEEKEISVTLAGNFLAFPGDRVQLELEHMGLSGIFRVAEAENRCSAKGATITLTLKE